MSAHTALEASAAVGRTGASVASIYRQGYLDTCEGRRNASGNPVKSVSHTLAGVASIVRSIPRRAEHYGEVDVPDLAQLAELSHVVERALRDTVTIMRRDDGYSWAEIGEALGITRQAAHERFGR